MTLLLDYYSLNSLVNLKSSNATAYMPLLKEMLSLKPSIKTYLINTPLNPPLTTYSKGTSM